ncbi:MAG: ABC transporter substrate-binding protein [Deltaproteobacteria bacterium]|nr:ABC transporter substrate-binding protein [Deltaproteobacteria bacterium]
MKLFICLILFALHQLCYCLEIGTVEEPPGNFIGKNGNIDGLSVDFVKEIQRRVGDNTPIQMLPGARLVHYSLTNPDFVVFSLSRTESREDNYHWISLVMRKPLVLFTKRDSGLNIRNLEDAKNIDSIGVIKTSVHHNFLLENEFPNIVTIPSHEQNFKMLMAGRISIMYYSMVGAAMLCKDYNIDFNELEPVLMLQVVNSSIAMSKNSDPVIVKAWQDAAKEIKGDGTFDKLAQKWLLFTEEYTGIPCEIKDGALNFWRE